MKKLILMIAMLQVSLSAVAEKSNIDCRSQNPAQFSASKLWALNYSSSNPSSHLNLYFNFASARLVCPTAVERAIERNQPFSCAGVWRFDYENPEGRLGTPVVARFSHQNNRWKVEYTTSYDYGRQTIELQCDIEVFR